MNPVQSPGLPWREVDARAIIISPKTGEIHELDPVGTFLWVRATGNHTLEALARELAEVYDVQSDTALADISEFFAELFNRQLIQWRCSPRP